MGEYTLVVDAEFRSERFCAFALTCAPQKFDEAAGSRIFKASTFLKFRSGLSAGYNHAATILLIGAAV